MQQTKTKTPNSARGSTAVGIPYSARDVWGSNHWAKSVQLRSTETGYLKTATLKALILSSIRSWLKIVNERVNREENLWQTLKCPVYDCYFAMVRKTYVVTTSEEETQINWIVELKKKKDLSWVKQSSARTQAEKVMDKQTCHPASVFSHNNKRHGRLIFLIHWHRKDQINHG